MRSVETPRGTPPFRKRILPYAAAGSLYLALEAVLIARSACPAQDGQRFLEAAFRMEEQGIAPALRGTADHPGYPLYLYAVFQAGSWFGIEAPRERLHLAQAATALSGLLHVLVAWRLFLRLCSPRVALGAAVSFAVLPRTSWIAADILSDPLHAAAWTLALLFAVKGIERGGRIRVLHFALAGLAASLAYAVRIEAAGLAVAVPAGLAAASWMRWKDPRFARGEPAKGAAVFLLAFLPVPLLFLAFYGRPSPDPVFRFFFAQEKAWTPRVVVEAPLSSPEALATLEEPDAGRHEAVSPEILHAGIRSPASAVIRFFEELGQLLQFVHIPFVALGILFALRSARRPRLRPLLCAAAVFIHSAGIIAAAARLGYSSGRYYLPILPLIIGCGMWGVSEAAGILRTRPGFGWIDPGRAVGLAAGLAVLTCGPYLAARRLHDTYHGTLEAGRWIALNGEPERPIADPYYYPTYLAGLRSRRVELLFLRRSREPAYAIAQDRDLETKAFRILRRAIDAGRTRELVRFPRVPGRDRGWVRVYAVAPR